MANTRQPIAKLRYQVNKLDSIRSAIAGYAGGQAIMRELVQNADDARSTWLEFHFQDDALVVKNGSVFSDDDFTAIARIASGSKRADEEKIGTWGTGFLSVYQITDHPELESAGRHVTFDPTVDELDVLPSDVQNYTVFRFPWRRDVSLIAEEIEAEAWSNERIAQFEHDVAAELYRVLPFLRHIERITLYHHVSQGEPLRTHEVTRTCHEQTRLKTQACRERWEITWFDHRQGQRSDIWLVYRAVMNDRYVSNNTSIKSSSIAVGYGPDDPWLTEHVPGTLYNYLPTGINTGFAFQINADFFPDANRTTIRMDNSRQGTWNRSVINVLAHLIADHLEYWRDEAASPDAFYRLLPLDANRTYPFLASLVQHVRTRAKDLLIIRTTDDQWTKPRDVRWIDNSQLRALAENYLPAIAPGHLQPALRDFIDSAGGRRLQLEDFLSFIKQVVQDGTALAAAPAVMNSREKLDAALTCIASTLGRYSNPAQKQKLLHELNGTPLCLDEDEELFAFGEYDIRLADVETRNLLPPRARWLADLRFQEQHRALLTTQLKSLSVTDVVSYLEEIAPECAGRPIEQAHPAINCRAKLQAYYEYLLKREAFAQRPSGAGLHPGKLALSLDEDGTLQYVVDGPYIADTEVRALLAADPPRFIDARIQVVYQSLLQQMGAVRLTPSRVIDLLEQRCYGRCRLVDGPILFRTVDGLHPFYQYFLAHASELTPGDRMRLCSLRFVLTQGGDLAAIADPEMPLLLPPASRDTDDTALDDVLQLDNLISERILTQKGRFFFEDVLGVPPLTSIEYIDKYAIPYYARETLSHDAKFRLLQLIRDAYPRIQQQSPRLRARLAETPLIRCADDRYRQAVDVYFPSEFLDQVFSGSYAIPHPTYSLHKATSSKKRPADIGEDNGWVVLFLQLGMQREPAPGDLIQSVQATVAHPPTDARIAHIRQIYEVLDQGWVDRYSRDKAPLEPLRTLAWLPAADDKPQPRWHRPNELFPRRLRALVESQVPLLAFREPQSEFATFLQLNVQPNLKHVVNHLLWLSENDHPVNSQLYEYLNRFADTPEICVLAHRPVIYDQQGKRFWLPKHAFIGDYSEDFGPYRCYLRPGDADAIMSLLTALGVRTRPDPVADFVQLLQEIAAYKSQSEVSDEDRHLINHAYLKLTSAWEESDADLQEDVPDWIDQLKDLPVVVDDTRHLNMPSHVFFKDQPELLTKFPDQSIRTALYTHDRTRALLEALGVRSLSHVVHRRKRRVEGDVLDHTATARLRLFMPQFRRLIAAFSRQLPGEWTDPNTLREVEVYDAERIEVEYVIDALHPAIQGASESQEAFFDVGQKRLYLATNSASSRARTSLAREVALMLNPTLKPQHLISTIKMLLDAHTRAEADAVLDECEVDHLDVMEENASLAESPQRQPFAQLGITSNVDTSEAFDDVGHPGDAERGSIRRPITSRSSGDYHSGDYHHENDSLQDSVPQQADPIFESRTTVPDSVGSTGEEEFVPPFTGEKRPRVPIIYADYAELRERYGVKREDTSLETLGDVLSADDTATAISPGHVNLARFILSFMNRYQGFLPLTREAASLFYDEARIVTCVTDEGEQFPLYIDSAQRIIYNQEELPRFFAKHLIPAGGIVYLEREHAHTFRLFYRYAPHVVRNVRRAEFGEDGKVHYIVQPEVEVECETSDLVFLAETRLEDPEALFAEARGNDAVFVILMKLFESNPENRVHQEELFRLLSTIRMVSYAAVCTELRERPCFIDEGNGYWSFDPAQDFHRRTRSPSRSRQAIGGNVTNSSATSARTGSTPTDLQKHLGLQYGLSAPDEVSRLADHRDASALTTGHSSQREGQTQSPVNDRTSPARSEGIDHEETPQDTAARLARDLIAIQQGLIASSADSQRLSTILTRFRGPFVEFVATVEDLYRHEASNRIDKTDRNEGKSSPASSGAEIATYLLAQLKQDPAAAQVGADFEAVFDAVLARAIDRDAIRMDELDVILTFADPLTWDQYIRPQLDLCIRQLIEQHAFAAANTLLEIDEKYSGRSREAEREQLARRKEAWDWLVLCDGSNPVDEELAILRDALGLEPHLLEARQRYGVLVQQLLAPHVQEARHRLESGHCAEMVAAYEESTELVNAHLAYLPDLSAMHRDLNSTCEDLLTATLELARKRIEQKKESAACEAYIAAARLYVALPIPSTRTAYRADYLEALEEIGNYYRYTGRMVEAVTMYSRAIDFWQGASNGAGARQVVTIRSRLADAYERLGAWDWAQNTRKKIVETCAPTERQKEEILLERAIQEARHNTFAIAAAHEQLIKELQRLRSTPDIAAVIGRDHLDMLIARERQRQKRT